MALSVSLLLPWVEGLVGKAADALVEKIATMWGVENYRSKLERQLLYVRSLLADAEEKAEANTEAGCAVKAWMKKLKAAAYEADDVLDDFQHEALRREAQGDDSSTRKVLYFSRDRLVFHQKASRDLKNVLDKIEDLVAEINTFGLLERAEAPQVLYRQTHSALDETADIFGRYNDKEVLVKLLLDQQDQKNVQVLPIIGMGGLGKTTLAKMVYNDHRVQNHFDLKMWHCVSENFEAAAVVRSVIEVATNERCDLGNNIELLRAKLQEVIGRKRCLLILDDVWNEERPKWEDSLKPLLCSSIVGLGSMIVVTSRSRQVASIMGTLPPHEPACLSEDDSWELFSKKAFNLVQDQAELVIIGRRISNKCKGLPLALKTMGGLMSSKQHVQEWEAIADSNVGKDEVLPILKLSYKHLSPEMKQCFAFCAVFPKDYEMEKDMLIQLWMANGYIHEDGGMDLAQKGEFIFNELVWRSFLQAVISVRKPVYLCVYDFDYTTKRELNGCKMHDLMHDLAEHIAKECASAEELIQRNMSINDIRHLQIFGDQQLDGISRLFTGTIHLRTLLVPKSSVKDLTNSKLMPSRALWFNSIDTLNVQSLLSHTRSLRYLDLSSSGIVSLPNSICVLYNLLSLRLNYCLMLKHLPEGMGTLRKLSHIYLLGCKSLERMPPNLSLLHNLRTLTTFIVDTEGGCGIEELKDLQKLGNRLELYNLWKVNCGSKANLHEKQNLDELLLHWGRHMDCPTVDEPTNQEQVMESLEPHCKLKILEVYGYGGLRVSQWMRKPHMFQCLRALIMTNCPGCKDLPIVWLSSSLEHLSLSGMRSLTTLCNNINLEAQTYNTSVQIVLFPKLKTMELLNLPELERWAENSAGEINSSVTFPQLEKLVILHCGKLHASLAETPVVTDVTLSHVSMCMPLAFLTSLVCLSIFSCRVDVLLPPGRQQGQRQRSVGTLRKLELCSDDSFISIFDKSKLQLGLRDCLAVVEESNISLCSNIVCWPVEELRCLPRLRYLHIMKFSKLEGKCSSSEEEEEILPLPQLERLVIRCCEILLQIPKLPASLEEFTIEDSRSLVALPSNVGDLTKLRELNVRYCSALEALPGGMDGLNSLEKLTIEYCPGIEKFPQGLLRRLPALDELSIKGCPGLQRCCSEGGEYFDLVASIRWIYIETLPPQPLLPSHSGGSRRN